MSSKTLKQIRRCVLNNEATLEEVEEEVFLLKIFDYHGERIKQRHTNLWMDLAVYGKMRKVHEKNEKGWTNTYRIQGPWLNGDRVIALRKIIEDKNATSQDIRRSEQLSLNEHFPECDVSIREV